MEGIAAVGAASSIIQLVDFSLKLLATGKEIRDSASGSTLQNEALEDVYRQMQSILQPVESFPASNVAQSRQSKSDHILPAARIAQRDCSEILSLLDKLGLGVGETSIGAAWSHPSSRCWDTANFSKLKPG
jgi:hypothetical protein